MGGMCKREGGRGRGGKNGSDREGGGEKERLVEERGESWKGGEYVDELWGEHACICPLPH